MFRTLVSVAAIFTLLFATLISPIVTHARWCPDEPPSTLLSLHRKSDAIYVAKFEKRTDGEIIQKDEESTTVNVSEHFSISSTLKGENQKFFVRTYEDYRYTGGETSGSPDGESESDRPEPGDTVLLFLGRAESTEDAEGAKEDSKERPGLDVIDRDGIRKIKDGDMSVYESRIKELNGIFSSKKPSDSAIAAWLIKCIEEPATRWDGAFDLMEGFEAIKWKEAREDQKKQKAESGEASEEDEIEYREDPNELDRAAFAKALTDAQKNQLLNISIESFSPKAKDEKQTAMSNGDSVLLELVKNWGDERLARALLERLRNSADDVYTKSSMMTTIAGLLDDKELAELADDFGTIAYQNANDTMGSADETETAETADTADVPEGEDLPESKEAPETPESENGDSEPEANKDEEPGAKTFGEARDELAAKFINRAEVVLSQEKESVAVK